MDKMDMLLQSAHLWVAIPCLSLVIVAAIVTYGRIHTSNAEVSLRTHVNTTEAKARAAEAELAARELAVKSRGHNRAVKLAELADPRQGGFNVEVEGFRLEVSQRDLAEPAALSAAAAGKPRATAKPRKKRAPAKAKASSTAPASGFDAEDNGEEEGGIGEFAA